MLRFAPSPTGDMHIGNLRVAILNYIIAKQMGVEFLVRIEDTDKARNIEGKDEEIMQLLEKFALIKDSTYHQSEHLHIHQTFAIRLLEEKKAFVCICSDEELSQDRDDAKSKSVAYRYSGKCENLTHEDYQKLKNEKIPFVIRLKKPIEPIINHDIIKGDISTAPNEVDSFVILRTDGTPTYNFACASDDMISDISMIIRGEDHLSNTPKQIHIKNLLGYTQEVKYAHLPIILNDNGKKMSKRDKASSVKWLLMEGFIPDAIINYLILLGNSKTPKEIFTLPEAIEWFKLEDISKSSARFDIDKLRFINREHLKMMDERKLSTLFGFADANIGKLAKLYLEESSTIKELDEKLKSIFKAKDFSSNEWREQINTLREIIGSLDMIEDYNSFKNTISKMSGLKGKNLFKPLRLLLTGAEHGPELSEVYPFIKPYLLEIIS
ncbi:MAG: glutamate--tRNA ligase [Epsilonproteobacteria bacterium]|nr:glutamate--tRNA ligase [Campylobacterota bacterium]